MVDQLGLESTYIRPEDVMTHRFAVGHNVSDTGTSTAQPYKLNRAAYAAGGAIMSVKDMLGYAAFHLGEGRNAKGERLLSSASLQAMQADEAPRKGTTGTIGITWHIDSAGAVRTLSHGGATVGQIARLTLVPEHDFALAVVTNANTGRGASAGPVTKVTRAPSALNALAIAVPCWPEERFAM